MDERAVVERQLGRPTRAFRRVARRCPFGLPAVTEQDPYDASGDPFPTTYYLTCPHLVTAVSRVEADGGVERWSRAAREEPALAACLASANDEQQQIRPELRGGIGGTVRGGSLKCLHAHVAFALAQPGYELGDRILAEIQPRWPTGECCTRI